MDNTMNTWIPIAIGILLLIIPFVYFLAYLLGSAI